MLIITLNDGRVFLVPFLLAFSAVLLAILIGIAGSTFWDSLKRVHHPDSRPLVFLILIGVAGMGVCVGHQLCAFQNKLQHNPTAESPQ